MDKQASFKPTLKLDAVKAAKVPPATKARAISEIGPFSEPCRATGASLARFSPNRVGAGALTRPGEQAVVI